MLDLGRVGTYCAVSVIEDIYICNLEMSEVRLVRLPATSAWYRVLLLPTSRKRPFKSVGSGGSRWCGGDGRSSRCVQRVHINGLEAGR